ncbi:hypothetical protein GJ744_001192 [Endocarpon pusillum]|uniref:Uncharacterized protein n=1 Tax=Endocarpon pusillum TaxID=364733 RepID=A0A8H7ACJ6_9EURO|nr:hypothetical protein GJ744_001192 [Endocarpon pusillum]
MTSTHTSPLSAAARFFCALQALCDHHAELYAHYGKDLLDWLTSELSRTTSPQPPPPPIAKHRNATTDSPIENT